MRIGIAGTHCAGKTTFAHDLHGLLGIPLIEEVAGRFTEEERHSLSTQYKILCRQIEAEEAPD